MITFEDKLARINCLIPFSVEVLETESSKEKSNKKEVVISKSLGSNNDDNNVQFIILI